MSPFSVMVMGENPGEQLNPFYEYIETPRYVNYTKEQLIEKGRKRIDNFKNGTYADFLADKYGYKKDCLNKEHINYLENEFPLELKWNNDEIYAYEIQDYEPDEIGENDEVYSDYNPNAKWDYFYVGGRWRDMILLKNGRRCDQAQKQDIANISELITFAVLKEGQWYERGKMLWWGIVKDGKENDVWETELQKLVEGLPEETLITIVDCHI